VNEKHNDSKMRTIAMVRHIDALVGAKDGKDERNDHSQTRRPVSERDILACAEPTFLVRDGERILCTKDADSSVLYIDSSQAHVLTKTTQFLSLHEHCINLSEQDWRNAVLRLVRLRIIPNWLSSYIVESHNKSHLTENGSSGTFYKRRFRELLVMCKKGLLVSERQLLQEIGENLPAIELPIRINCVGIPTSRRPRYLEQSLDSFLGNLTEFSRSDTTTLVADDSNDTYSEKANREVVQECRRKYGMNILYCGTQGKANFAQSLSRICSVPADVINFALAPPNILPTHGAPRNLLTLLTTGHCILETDDDTLCSFCRVGNEVSSVCISASPDPCETSVYSSHEANCSANPPEHSANALAIHEEYLGRSVPRILRESIETGWREIRTDLVPLLRNSQGRVAITATGCMGDCGLYSSAGFLRVASLETVRRIFATEESSQRALKEREVMRAAPVVTISRGASFHAMSFALDNRLLVPPFFPIGRNEDGAFGTLSLISDSSSWIGHLPWAVHHRSEPGRQYMASYIEGSVKVRLTEMLTLCLQSLSIPASVERSFALRSIGEQLRCIAALPKQSFASFLTIQYMRSRNAMVRSLEERVSQNELPQSWRERAEEMIKALRRSSSDSKNAVPVDLSKELGETRALECAQDSIGMYGRLLVHWEELVQGARIVTKEDLSLQGPLINALGEVH
jgi:hypothetical protein